MKFFSKIFKNQNYEPKNNQLNFDADVNENEKNIFANGLFYSLLIERWDVLHKASAGIIGGYSFPFDVKKTKLALLLGKNLKIRKDNQAVEDILNDEKSRKKALLWVEKNIDNNFKLQFFNDFDDFARRLEISAISIMKYIKENLFQVKYEKRVKEKIISELKNLKRSLIDIKNNNKNLPELEEIVLNVDELLDKMGESKMELIETLINGVCLVPTNRIINKGKLMMEVEINNDQLSNQNEGYIINIRYDIVLKASFFAIFFLDCAMYLLLLDKLSKPIYQYISSLHSEDKEFKKEYIEKVILDCAKRIKNMQITSVEGGRLYAIDLALQYVLEHTTKSHLASEKDIEEVLGYLDLPEFPMEERLGRIGGFEYLVKSAFPTIDGKTGSKGVTLLKDFLWVLHPHIEEYLRENKKISKNKALKIIESQAF